MAKNAGDIDWEELRIKLTGEAATQIAKHANNALGKKSLADAAQKAHEVITELQTLGEGGKKLANTALSAEKGWLSLVPAMKTWGKQWKKLVEEIESWEEKYDEEASVNLGFNFEHAGAGAGKSQGGRRKTKNRGKRRSVNRRRTIRRRK
jgi:hypothetical protein